MTTDLFVNTDVTVIINIGTGFTIADVVSMSVTLSKAGSTITTTFSGGAVVVGASSVTLSIPDSGGVTSAGLYNIKILMTDTGGNVRGLTATPNFLEFKA